ncbi:unnamed protein product [Amoebophrya sp. A25]|nr:unnamed protein product [Amoebophrya sp. A25]|eukprot:GSA25T00014768001.1
MAPVGSESRDASAARRSSSATSIGHYILGKTIGEGTFGKVKLGTHILTGEKVAVKILEKERIVDVADVERVAREIHILKLIRHPHIIQLYEIIETPKQLYLIMEFASGGELFDYIVSSCRVKEKEAVKFFHQILNGVEKIHSMRVVHRDLKPENLLLDGQKHIKIVDFGLSNTYKPGQLLKTACGSPCYAAPEMIAGKKYVPIMCDVWSCGVILFALVCGYLPFEDQNTAALYKKILGADYQTPKFISESVTDLIGQMLTTDPQKRITCAQIRKHPWYQGLFGPYTDYAARPPDIQFLIGRGCEVPDCPYCLHSQTKEGGIPIEEDIVQQLEKYGFPREYALKCLEMNKHNHVTTTYYLLARRKFRAIMSSDEEGTVSAADVAQPMAAFDLQQGNWPGEGVPIYSVNTNPQIHQPGRALNWELPFGNGAYQTCSSGEEHSAGAGGGGQQQRSVYDQHGMDVAMMSARGEHQPGVVNHLGIRAPVGSTVPGTAQHSTHLHQLFVGAAPASGSTSARGPRSTSRSAGTRRGGSSTARGPAPSTSSGGGARPASHDGRGMIVDPAYHYSGYKAGTTVPGGGGGNATYSASGAGAGSGGGSSKVPNGYVTPRGYGYAKPTYSSTASRPWSVKARGTSTDPQGAAASGGGGASPHVQFQPRSTRAGGATGGNSSNNNMHVGRSMVTTPRSAGAPSIPNRPQSSSSRNQQRNKTVVSTSSNPTPGAVTPSTTAPPGTTRGPSSNSTGGPILSNNLPAGTQQGKMMLTATGAVVNYYGSATPQPPAHLNGVVPPLNGAIGTNGPPSWTATGRVPLSARGVSSNINNFHGYHGAPGTTTAGGPGVVSGLSAAPLSARTYASTSRPPGAYTSYDVVSSSNKSAKQILGELQRALTMQRVMFKQSHATTGPVMKCQKHAIKFDLEISGLEGVESHMVKFRRTGGDVTQYKELCNKLLTEIKV